MRKSIERHSSQIIINPRNSFSLDWKCLVHFPFPFCCFSIFPLWQSSIFEHNINLFTSTLTPLHSSRDSPAALTSPSHLYFFFASPLSLDTVAHNDPQRNPLFCFSWHDPNCFGQERHCCLWWKSVCWAVGQKNNNICTLGATHTHTHTHTQRDRIHRDIMSC